MPVLRLVMYAIRTQLGSNKLQSFGSKPSCLYKQQRIAKSSEKFHLGTVTDQTSSK
jgi:hypothetical protein